MAATTKPNRTVDNSLGSPPTSTTQLGGGVPRSSSPQPGLAPGVRRPAGAGGTRHFLRHLIEMVLAMMVGMMALGALERVILAAAGTSATDMLHSAPEAVAVAMAFNMTVGMTVWMRHRGHSWAMCAEMAGAMVVPAIAAIVLFWCGVIHSGSVLGAEHAPMLPAMIAVMLFRRSEYSQPVHARA